MRCGRLDVLALAGLTALGAPVIGAQEPADLASHTFPTELAGCSIGTVRGVCGTMTVPENRDLQDGRQLDLFVAIVPADPERRVPDPIVVLEGGPGASVVHFAGLHVQTFANATGSRDLVLIDQRGTGRSAPLDCDLTNAFTELATPERTRTCRDTLVGKADLTRYTTDDAVLDLADLLGRLGYERVNLFGISNGTRTALHFARRHPQRVRSMVLLAPYPFSHNVLVEGGETLDKSLALLATDCAQDARCGEAFPTLAQSVEQLRSPDPPSDVDWPLFTAMLRMMLFFPLPASHTPSLITSVASGCRPPSPGAAQTQLAGWISEGAFLSILCAEDAARTSVEEIHERSIGSVLGPGWAESLVTSCHEWPRRPLPDDFEAPMTAPTPALLLVGRLDPAMPPTWSQELAATMPNARVVEVAEGQHSFVGMTGVGCILRLVEQFLERGSAVDLDTSCVDEIHRPPFTLPAG